MVFTTLYCVYLFNILYLSNGSFISEAESSQVLIIQLLYCKVQLRWVESIKAGVFILSFSCLRDKVVQVFVSRETKREVKGHTSEVGVALFNVQGEELLLVESRKCLTLGTCD